MVIGRTRTKAARGALWWIWLLLSLAAPTLASAQTGADLQRQLRGVEREIRAVERGVQSASLNDAERGALADRLSTARETAATVADQLDGQLTLVNARILELGPKPAAGTELPEVRDQRVRLAAEHSSLDSTVKQAKLLLVEADQVSDGMRRKDAEQRAARLSQRVDSPLTPAFWGAVLEASNADFVRIDRFASAGEQQVRAQGRRTTVWPFLLSLVAAVALLTPLRRGALRMGQRYLISDAPGLRLRRSGYAIWRVFVNTLAPLLAAAVLTQGARWGRLVPPSWNGLLDSLVQAAGFSGFTAAVLGALLMRSQPSWRIAPINDEVARRLRPSSWILAALTFFGITIDAFNKAVGASGAAFGAAKAIEAGGSLILIAGAMLSLGRIRAAATASEDEDEDGGGAVTTAGLGAVSLVVWLAVIVAGVALAIGFVDFSLMTVTMLVWATVLGAAVYLLMIALDDVSVGIFNRSSRIGRTLIHGVGISASRVDQFGVILSGVSRVAVALVALIFLLMPLTGDSGIGTRVERLSMLASGVQIGGVSISPGAILRGLIVLMIGLALVRGFMGWLERRYLPATALDGSGRNSVSLIARYVGLALAVIWALASLGIGVEKIALLLSALSVGIGFGLQAITQNFVSGLILLAERPIKIGDLVKIGQDEGDVKRISVRSTEIELPDHSTLIVPNSELITKTVLNKTMSAPLGRIQIQFTVPIETDAERVRALLLELFEAEPAVLETPQAKVFIDSIANGRVAFNAFAHVASPRDAYSARSAVLIALLGRARAEGIEIGSFPQRVEFAPVATDQDAAGGDAHPPLSAGGPVKH